MVFDFDIIYIKGNTMWTHYPGLRFQSENGEEHENSENISQNTQQRNTRPDTMQNT